MNHRGHTYTEARRLPATLKALLAALLAFLALTMALAPPARAELSRTGPIDPTNGYPYWYEDENGLRLDLCLDPQDEMCLQPFEMPDPGAPVSFPDNFPAESFWWIAEAETTTDSGADALLSMAMEAAWGGPDEAVRDGDQISFGRMRIRVDDLRVGSVYRVIHPYGTNEFGPLADDDGDGAGEINYTADMGCLTGAINRCDFDEALASDIGPFLAWDTFGEGTDPALRGPAGEPDAYVGDPDVPHRVKGSPAGTNHFEVQELNAVGEWVTIARTDEFTVAGKVATPQVQASHRDSLYNANQNVELIPSDPSYEVYYTEDGSEPTASSARYGSPILVDAAPGSRETTTLRFVAVDPGTGRRSQIVEKSYTIDRAAPNVVSSVPGGTYEDIPDADGDGSPDNVVLSIAQDPEDPTNVRTAEIVYTTDGTAPAASRDESGALRITNGRAYPEEGIEVRRSTTLKAIAVDDAGNVSRVETFDYKIAALRAAGPTSPLGGYPFWYEDKGTDVRAPLRLDLCLDPNDLKCNAEGLEGVDPSRPISFPDNFPAEAFWWTGEADLALPNSDKSILVMAHEAAWGGPDEAVRDGDQIVFSRIRIRIDGLQIGREYRVSHPYGTATYVAEDDGKGGGEINVTEDIGCGELGPVTPCDFDEARFGRIGPFLTWDTFGQGTDPALRGPAGEPDAYVGDPAIPHEVVGSPVTDAQGNPQNYFMLERRTQEGGWQEVARTDQFAISGKVSGLQAVPNVQGGVFNEPQTVTLAASDPNATIIFTTDGTDPQVATGEQGTGGGLPLATVGLFLTSLLAASDDGGVEILNGTEYTGPISISETTELRYIVVSGGEISRVFSQRYVIDTEAPTVGANPDGGTYGEAQLVTLQSSEEGAEIHYTTDGSRPTTESAVYSSPIRVDRSQTIRALAVDAAGNRGEVASFEYVIDGEAPTVSASPAGGSFDRPRKVTLSTDDPESRIHYTLDGSRPTAGSALYEAPISISRTTTLRFFAIDAAGNASEIVTQRYVIRAASSVSLNVAKTALKLGKSRVVSGRVSPAHPGKTVKVTIKRNGKPVLVRTLRLNGVSAYGLKYRPGSVGRYTVQVSFAGDRDHRPDVSATKGFRVVRR